MLKRGRQTETIDIKLLDMLLLPPSVDPFKDEGKIKLKQNRENINRN